MSFTLIENNTIKRSPDFQFVQDSGLYVKLKGCLLTKEKVRIYLELTSNGYQLSYIVTKCVIIKPEFKKGNPWYPKAIMNNE